jgi:hypothetical protein
MFIKLNNVLKFSKTNFHNLYVHLFITGMKKLKISLLILPACFLFISCSSKAQTNAKEKFIYRIDKTIEEEVNKKMMEMKNGALLDTKCMVDGKQIDIPFMSGANTSCYAVIQNKKDTIVAVLSPMVFSGYGVILMNFYNDTVIAFHINAPRDKEKRYKKIITDTVYESYIETKPVICRIIVSEKPERGKTILGYIEFEGEDFYQKGNIKESYQAKGCFKISMISEE